MILQSENDLRRVISEEITLIREYRTRLIADVVTGQLDVRQAAALLPEPAKEPGELDQDEVEKEGDEDLGLAEEEVGLVDY